MKTTYKKLALKHQGNARFFDCVWAIYKKKKTKNKTEWYLGRKRPPGINLNFFEDYL